MEMNRYHFPVLVLAFICNRHVSGQTNQMVDICQTNQIQFTGGVSVSTPNYPSQDTNTDASCQCLITWSSSGNSNVTLSYTTWSFSAYTTSCWGWLDYQYDVSSPKTLCLSNVPSNPIISQYTTNGLLLRYRRESTIFDKRGKFLLTVNVSPPGTIIIVSSARGSSMVYPRLVSTAIPPGGSSAMPPAESTNAPMPSTQFQSANPSNNPASTLPTTIPPQPASVQPPQPSLPPPTSTTTQSSQLAFSSNQNGTSTTTTSSNITSNNNNSSIIPDPLTTNDETANGLATSSIIGIAVGVGGFFIIATIVVIVVACIMCRRSQKKEIEKEKEKVELEMKNASIRSRPAVPLPVSDPEGIRTENEYQLDGGYMEIQEAQKKPVPGPGNIVFKPQQKENDVNGTGLYYRISDMTSAKIPRSSGDVPNNNSGGSTDNASNDVIYIIPGNSTLSAQQENARNESSGPKPGTSELKLKLTGMSSVRIC